MVNNQSKPKKNCAELLKAVADDIRLKILHRLFQESLCVSDLMDELNLSQSHVSHHLKILKNAGLVEAERDGHKIYYQLSPMAREGMESVQEEKINLGCCEVKFK